MNRKTGIIIALIFAVILTLAINISATRKYTAVTRAVKAIQATKFIPVGDTIDASMVKTVNVPAQMAPGLATDINAVTGKSARVSILQGQYLMQGAVDTQGRDLGTVEIYVPVTVPSGACAIPGQLVDVYQKGNNNSPSVLLCREAKVLNTVDSSSKETEAGQAAGGPAAAMGSSTVVAAGIEVPAAQAVQVVSAASQNEVYLALSAL